jgi:hypothetical protein
MLKRREILYEVFQAAAKIIIQNLELFVGLGEGLSRGR